MYRFCSTAELMRTCPDERRYHGMKDVGAKQYRQMATIGFLGAVCLVCLCGVFCFQSHAEELAPTLSAPSSCAVGEFIAIQGAAFQGAGSTLFLDVTDPNDQTTSQSVSVGADGSIVRHYTPAVAGLYRAEVFDGVNVIASTLFSASPK